MDFQPELDEDQYNREIDWDRPEAPVPPDVREQQERVNRADGLAFVYPVWWSDCLAKLKGWFDRVWSYGFAYFYEDQTARKSCLEPTKALALCPAGHTLEDLTETGIAQSMGRIMPHDRLHDVKLDKIRFRWLRIHRRPSSLHFQPCGFLILWLGQKQHTILLFL